MVKLVVGNLPPSASNQSLKEIFRNYDDLQDYKLISNYGFVFLESEESANHAVTNLSGLEYRGFPITVDFVGDSRSKRKLPASNQPCVLSRAPIQKSFMTSVFKQRLESFNNEEKLTVNNTSVESYSTSRNKNSWPQLPIDEYRNPYNLPFTKPGYAETSQNNMISEKGYETQSFDNYPNTMYGSQTLSNNKNIIQDSQSYDNVASARNNYNYSQDDQHKNPRTFSKKYIPEEEYFSNISLDRYRINYKRQYIPKEEYFSNVPSKRFRTNVHNKEYIPKQEYFSNMHQKSSNALIDDNEYIRRRPLDSPEDEFRAYRIQRNRFEENPALMDSPFLDSNTRNDNYQLDRRDFQLNKSYIDEYQDGRDYNDVDPYPAYLKQYRR